VKKLTLNQSWTWCLRMWRWIAKEKRQGSRKQVTTLKREFRIAHGIKPIVNDCFFCEHDDGHYSNKYGFCECCPGRSVDPAFHCEYHASYRWDKEPEAFYKKLLELNRIRKAQP